MDLRIITSIGQVNIRFFSIHLKGLIVEQINIFYQINFNLYLNMMKRLNTRIEFSIV